jgi:mannose PTS system EIIA component
MIGLLIVAHGTLGESLIHCASHVMGKRPLYLRQLGVTIHDDPEAILPQGRDLVLVMTDIFGATPANIACRLLEPNRVEGISGINLPMLIKALSYREESMKDLIEKSLAGASEGVIRMPGGC